MAYIKEYWDNKNERAAQAKKHTEVMSNKYGDEIQNSVSNTKIYNQLFNCSKEHKYEFTNVTVINMDTVSAAEKYCDGKTAVLNFASYKNPGGKFIEGSKAQEECLCHESYLYNVLLQFQEKFYDWNNHHKNNALYLNRALYSPNVLFKESVFCDVITCAAPNKSAAQKFRNILDTENTTALRSRIKFVLDIAVDNDIETLILGAYGCGVFGQNPKEVAGIFKEYLNGSHKYCFKNVIFAIPAGRDGNLNVFRNVFTEGK